jgi:RNA polymerase sigma-70 factor (ECF subfamily)
VFNEGYAATAGDDWIRRDLCKEAIRLATLLGELTDEAEAKGLLALMLFHDARRDARVDDHGDVVLLEDQDRSRWDRAAIARGLEVGAAAIRQTLAAGGPDAAGPYVIQASIAAAHAQAARAKDTPWRDIAELYRRLYLETPTPVVALNRAVAIAMSSGPAAGLAVMADLADELDGYHLFHAARADLLRRLGRIDEAAAAYRAALALVGSEPERRFLERRLNDLTS